MLGAALPLAVSCVLGATSLELGIRSEARTRTFVVEGAESQSFLDSDVVPRVGLVVDDRRLRLGVNYEPHLLWVDATRRSDPDVLHHGNVAVTWGLDPIWRLSSAADMSYGTTSFLALPLTAVTPGQPFQPVPTVSKVRYGHADVSAGLRGLLGRGVRTTGSLGYSIDGGVDAPSQTTYPLVRAARLGVGLDWDVTRTGVLASALSLSWSAVNAGLNAGRQSVTGVATVTWRQRIDLENTWWLGVGISGYQDEGGGAPSNTGALPAGEAGFQHTTVLPPEEGEGQALPGQSQQGQDRPGQQGQGEAGQGQQGQDRPGQQGQGEAGQGQQGQGQPGQVPVPVRPRSDRSLQETLVLRAAPYFDRLSGDTSEQLQASGSVAWTLSRHWRLQGTVAAGVVPRSHEEPASIAALETRATWRPEKLEISVGLRGLWQRDPRIVSVPIKQWGVLFGIAFADVERL